MFNKLSISTLLAIASMASASPVGGFRPPNPTYGQRRNSKPQPNAAGSKLAKKFAKMPAGQSGSNYNQHI